MSETQNDEFSGSKKGSKITLVDFLQISFVILLPGQKRKIFYSICTLWERAEVSMTAATPSASKICSFQPLILWNSYADYFILNFRLSEGVSMV